MRVERISEPENVVQRAYFEDICEFLEEIDHEIIVSAEMDGELLCLRLRKTGGGSTAHVAVPIKSAKAVLSQHILVAIDRIPPEPESWPEGFAEMSEKPHTPKVGVGVMIIRIVQEQIAEGYVATRGVKRVLLGLRQGSHGEGEWSLPGGHLELGETPRACARRGLMEETGIAVRAFRELGWSNDVMPEEGLHYVTLFLSAEVDWKIEATLNEPDKTLEWRWFALDELPSNLFAPTASLLSDRKRLDRMFS